MTASDLLVRVRGLPGTLRSPTLSRLIPGSSSSDLKSVVESLNLSVLGWGESAELSSSILVHTLSGEDKLLHSSVAHHGVNHALEFFG